MQPVVLAVLIAVFQPAAGANNSVIASHTITQICLAAFQAAMAQAGQAPPPGMGADTCNCFLREVEQGEGLDVAQAICKAEAAEKYKL